MDKYTLKAEPRDVLRKKVKQLRKAGKLPAAIFGFNGNSNVQLDAKEFTRVFHSAGETSVVEVDLGGKNHNVLISEVQFNPLTREYTHASLREVNMKVEITATVPFELVGDETSPAVKEEEHLIILAKNEIEVRGLPKNMPHAIVIDVSGMHAGDTILVKDITLPEGIELLHEEEKEDTAVTTSTAAMKEVAIESTVETPEGEEGAAEGEAAPKAEGEEKKEEE